MAKVGGHQVTSSQEQSVSLFQARHIFLCHCYTRCFRHKCTCSNTCEHILYHYVHCADKHCTRRRRWPTVNVDLAQKAVKYTQRDAEKEVLDHTWRGTHWTYVTLWFASRRVRRDVTRFKTCDTLPVRDTLTPFTGGQVFRVKRDVIPHTYREVWNPLLNQIVQPDEGLDSKIIPGGYFFVVPGFDALWDFHISYVYVKKQGWISQV